MTTDWKSTIHRAYTTPNLLHPTLQKSIPSLIRDEISKLANLTLFQTNVQASSSHSQVPVDMRFTDDSLNIRISKNAPWISLVPSNEPMSPEERAVDAIRKDVMEKIALLWGGIAESSDESDSGHSSSGGSSAESNTSNSRRTRSRRSQRAEHTRRLNHDRGDSITISGNTIDSSTHTTNNYYGCTDCHPHSSRPDVREEAVSRREMETQTDPVITPPATPPPVYQSGAEELDFSDDSRESLDSSSDESKQSFTSDKSKTEKKTLLDTSDTESESSDYPESNYESEYDLRSSFSINSKINDAPESSNSNSAEAVNSTIHDLEKIASDLERFISKDEVSIDLDDLDISEEESHLSSNQDIPELMTFPDNDSDQAVNSTIDYLENLASQFERIISEDTKASLKREQSTNTEDSAKWDTSSNTVPKDLKSTSTETDPNVSSSKTQNADQEVQTEQDLLNDELIHSSTKSIGSFEDIISSEDISNLNQFVNDALMETEAFIEIANNFEEELEPQLISSILTNQTILQELQDTIDSDPQLVIGSDKIYILLSQLDLETLQLIHNNPSLEIPYLNQEDSSTLVNSIETSIESENFEDDEIDSSALLAKIRNVDQEVQTDTEASLKREQSTNTEDSAKRDTSSNTVPKDLKSTSTETDPNVSSSKTQNADQEVQTEQDLLNDELIYSSTKSIGSFEDIISSEDISNLNQFVNDALMETEAFIEIANNFEEELEPQLISSILTNQTILQELQDTIDSDPQLVIGSDRIDFLLNQLNVETLQLIHNNPNLEIPYLNQEDSSSDSSTLVNSTETSIESEDSEDSFIDDEIQDQPLPTYMQSSGSSSSEDFEDELEALFDQDESWISNPIYVASANEKETQNISTQTDVYTTENEVQLQDQLRKLQESFERTKSTHKNELASMLRAQDRLASTADEKIKQILQDSIQNEKESFSRYQHLHEKYNKLLEDSTVEIEDLKKALKDFETLDLAKKAEIDRLRNQFYSPAPIIISEKEKVETKTQSTQVEDTAKPATSIPVESKPTTVKTSPPAVSKQKSGLHDRNLEVASLMTLRKEKAALELSIQKNQFPKTELATKKDLLKKIDEELVRRNQRPQKSAMNKESKIKTPLTRNKRDQKDLGKEPFNILQTNLNDKRTSNK